MAEWMAEAMYQMHQTTSALVEGQRQRRQATAIERMAERVPGVRGEAMMNALDAELENDPISGWQAFEQHARQATGRRRGSQGANEFVMDYVARKIRLKSQKNVMRVVLMLAHVYEAFEMDNYELARARTGLALGAMEQFGLDFSRKEGQWDVAWALTNYPHPVWNDFTNPPERTDREREVKARGVDPRRMTAARAITGDDDRLRD